MSYFIVNGLQMVDDVIRKVAERRKQNLWVGVQTFGKMKNNGQTFFINSNEVSLTLQVFLFQDSYRVRCTVITLMSELNGSCVLFTGYTCHFKSVL